MRQKYHLKGSRRRENVNSDALRGLNDTNAFIEFYQGGPSQVLIYNNNLFNNQPKPNLYR